MMFLTTIFSSSFAYASPKTIHLNTTNVLTVRGTIDDAVANKFIYDLNKDINRASKYVYLDTNGGSVSAGAADDVADTSDGSDTTISFVGGSSVAGDWIKIVSDGTNYYIVGGLGKVAAGITIS